MKWNNPRLLLLGITLLHSLAMAAEVPKDLPYPSGALTAEETAKQVYFVNQFFGFSNVQIKEHPRGLAVVIVRPAGGRASTSVLEVHLNNAYDDGVVSSKKLIIHRTGRQKSQGMLITDYVDESRAQQVVAWVPELRKVKRFAEPPLDADWAGSDITMGDMMMRKVSHETHELAGRTRFDECLNTMRLGPSFGSEWLARVPGRYCRPHGRQVYRLKSTPVLDDWWYDYRLSYVDVESFADYRVEYFKDGRLIKVLDKAWRDMGYDDPRALFWRYWYAKDLETGHETIVVVPRACVRCDVARDEDFWSVATLEKLAR